MSITLRCKKWGLVASLVGASLVICEAQVYEVYDQNVHLTKKINDDHIFLLGDAIRVSDKNNQLQLLNRRYEPFLNLDGEAIYQYLTPWIIVSNSQKFGAYHEYGEQVMNAEYDRITCHYNQLLAQKGNTFFHYHRGSHDLQPIGTFEKAYLAANGQVIAKSPQGFQLPLSSNPEKVYDHLKSASENTIVSIESTGYGLINRHGDYILDPIIDTIIHLEDDFFYAYNENQHMLLKAGENSADIRYSSYHKISLEEDGTILEYIHGKLRRVMKKDGILLDITGMDRVRKVGQDHYNVYFKNKKVGLLNSKGIWEVIPSENLDEILPGNQGLYGALINGSYGFVDRLGKLQINNKFEEVRKFYDDRAAVKSNGKWGYVNLDGEEIISTQYDKASEFRRGLAIVQQHGKAKLIDKDGQAKLKKDYHQIYPSSDEYFITEDDGMYGLVAPTGAEISSPKFETLRREAFDKIIVKKNGKYGLMKESGDYALPIYYQNIIYDQATKSILAEDIYSPPVLVKEIQKKDKKKKGA